MSSKAFVPVSVDEFYMLDERNIHSAFAFIGGKAIKNLAEMIVPRPTHEWYQYGDLVANLQRDGFNFRHILRIVRDD